MSGLESQDACKLRSVEFDCYIALSYLIKNLKNKKTYKIFSWFFVLKNICLYFYFSKHGTKNQPPNKFYYFFVKKLFWKYEIKEGIHICRSNNRQIFEANVR